MGYTLGQAAKACGLSKTTLSRAIRSGKLSASRNADQSFNIDPAELHRVFPPATTSTSTSVHQDTGALQREAQLLREMVDDLRRRLDQSEEERRQLSLRLLPDQRSWWRRIFRS
jgi:hypothetical protein